VLSPPAGMLNLFRTPTGKTIVGIIVFGIIVVFALEFRTGRGSPTANLTTECAVKYAGTCVDQKDYFAAYGVAARTLEPKAARNLRMMKVVLDGLAERELLVAEAERLGLAVSEDVLDRELAAGRAQVSLPAEQAEALAFRLGLCRRDLASYGCEFGAPLGVRQLRVSRTENEPFDYKLYEKEIRLLANRGPKEFRAGQEREILAEQVRDLVRQRARIAENEALAVFERERTRVVVRSVVLEREWFAKYAVDTSPAAVDKWAAANATQLDEALKAERDKFTAGCPLVSEIAVPLSSGALEQEKTEARAKLDELRARLGKGEAFESVAREASAAPSSAFGGKLGCLTSSYGVGSDLLLEAAKKLTPGALSEVIETPRALHVLRLDGTLDAASLEREARAQVARGLYLRTAADQSMRGFATELVNQTKAGAKLEEVTRALTDELARKSAPAKATGKEPSSPPGLLATNRPRFEVSPAFTQAGNPLPDVEPSEPLAARAFELTAPDAIDERPIETRTGLVVMQLKERTAASREEFDKSKGPLLRALQRAKAQEAVTRYVADLRKGAGAKLKIDARFAEEPKAESVEN
jgi:peptidyl-prolyl cis-trans isomerase D